MSKYLALVLFLFPAASSVGAQTVLNIRFDNENLARYFERVGNGVALDTLPDRKIVTIPPPTRPRGQPA